MADPIFATGTTGSIGQFTTGFATPLTTRLEMSVEQRKEELFRLTHAPYILIHLAGLTSVKECDSNPDRAFQLNVEGATRWLRAAHETGCRHFVYVSTSHVFRAKLQNIPCGVDDIPDAISVYGRTKVEAETELRHLAKKLGIRVTIARIFSVISEKMRSGFLFPEITRRVKESDFSPLPDYKNVRDFIRAEEAAVLLAKIGQTTSGPEIIHVCSGRARSVRDLAEEVYLAHGFTRKQIGSAFPPTDAPPTYLFSVPNLPK